MVAVKVILPKQYNPDSVDSLAVWVSEPSKADLNARRGKWDFTGCYVYLVEVRWDLNEPYSTVLSGCSALQAAINIYHDHSAIASDPEESLGRWGKGSPIDKLRQMGALIGTPKSILSLYKKRYITNEQTTGTDNKDIRLSDLLAYPIFIAGL
jgi:hypothetical protein